MSSIQNAYRTLVDRLTEMVGEAEARSVARLFFEDLFDWHRGRRDRSLTEAEVKRLAIASDRLLAGEPVQYVTGQADFFGLRLNVSPDVLIPRPETEELVALVLEEKGNYQSPRILDIGTGSGAIALAIKKHWAQAEIWALDISEKALAVARTNGRQLGIDIHWQPQDILDLSTWGSLPEFKLIISNPPYIPHSEAALMPSDVLAHEPHLALFVENDDPLLFYRKALEFARKKGISGGQVFFECNEFNAQEVTDLGTGLGFHDCTLQKDLQGKWRMFKAKI